MNAKILGVEGLEKEFAIRGRTQRRVRAVRNVSFELQAGKTLGLVGESGSGKTTTGYVIQGLYRPTKGSVWFRKENIELIQDEKKPLPEKWCRHIQIVLQNPGASLNPSRTIAQCLAVPLRAFGIAKKRRELRKEVSELLEMVNLPSDYSKKYPGALSGGEKQRVALARALCGSPSVLVLDEPTSALDVSVQAKILSLILELQHARALTFLLISHDLSVIRNIADRGMIMYLGEIVETSDTIELFTSPMHPYTKMLLSSIPVVSEGEEELKPARVLSRGEIPSSIDTPTGCCFHPRCAERVHECAENVPEVREVRPGHWVKCIKA